MDSASDSASGSASGSRSTSRSTPTSASTSSPALSTRGLSKHWGTFKANDGIDLDVAAGARHALIGPNGAGKTTLINLLTGFLEPTAGDILLDGLSITRLSQHQRVRRGMTRTFQINTLFPGLTVFESVMMAIHERRRIATRWWRPVGDRRTPGPEAHQAVDGDAADEAHELLGRLQLGAQADRVTRDLAYGKQRLVEIALALATRPRILLLDEPAAGIPEGESAELFEVIATLPRDVTILFIEHDMSLVFRFAETITVLVGGKVLVEGTPESIAADPMVRQVYLGEATHG